MQSALTCAFTLSLRWHYPTGSNGQRQISRTLSLHPQAPMCFLIQLLQSLLLFYENNKLFTLLYKNSDRK